MKVREPEPITDPCQKCKKRNATRLIDIHAAVKLLGVRLCTRCYNRTLAEYPASSGVHLPRYE